ncbi:MAG TPA: DegT/DnrJ/EryC1/StrS family aminotransferase [Bryobacteraceae bacterium]|jgi:perosamine synthetase|nr:DegT/DnrJ/EryC1/StrS family aminotransferase [Bryobacteraceae bacterium]
MRIPLSSPDISEADIAAVVEVLRTPRLSIGPKQEAFEAAAANYASVPYAVALSSGTAGLHLGLAALGIGEGDEVILPSFTFIAAANAVLYRRATPVFVDIDPRTLNLTAENVAAAMTPRTRAIMAVHTFGCPADLDPIMELAGRHGVHVIEDACEALGAEYRGRKAGGIGDLGVFAFYPNKPITTGEGGMVVTRDRQLAETMRALRNQGRRPADGWLDHALLGYNYRLSEINCALGLSQMARLDSILARRADRAACYREHLRAVPELILPVFEIAEGRVCWFVFVVRLAARVTPQDRDRIMTELNNRGIGCGRYFAPIHKQPLYAAYADRGHNLTVTEQAAGRTLALPFFNRLTDGQIGEVARALGEAIESVRR